ncbi:MAG: hypothetical protein ACJAW3_000680 [Lentimonas sp.]|jgi:hypothetical protein
MPETNTTPEPESLYVLATKLGIIPVNFRQKDFDEREPGYGAAMEKAFLQSFQYLADGRSLDIEMIDDLHSLAVNQVGGSVDKEADKLMSLEKTGNKLLHFDEK